MDGPAGVCVSLCVFLSVCWPLGEAGNSVSAGYRYACEHFLNVHQMREKERGGAWVART